jgi:predicted ribosome quality control (RQC) complex YloA/Tae2 family protein
MHTNYYFLRKLAPALVKPLAGLRFMDCFSQDRDEVVLVFAEAKGPLSYYRPFYIKATLRPDFSGLFFPETVRRARQNSVDLFEKLTEADEPVDTDQEVATTNRPGRIVTAVYSFQNERCLAIELENDYTLVFKFFGNRPNLLAFHGDTVIDLFNHKLATDYDLHLSQLNRPIDQSYEAYVAAGLDHRALFPTFGKVVNEWLVAKNGGSLLGVDRWPLIQETLTQLNEAKFYLTVWHYQPTLSLLPVGEIQRETDDPIEAANQFFVHFNGRNTLEQERGVWLRLLDKRQKRAHALIDAALQRLMSRDEGLSHEQMGHILMANLHDIDVPLGMRSPERISLYDFYHDQPVTLKLKPDFTPQRNAENFYRKAKNEKIEEEHLTAQITTQEEELVKITEQRRALTELISLKELRKYVKHQGLTGDTGANDLTVDQLFKEVNLDGFRILIGRNARNNDLLTQRFAYKEDLWLHARDVSGSHVLIKYRAGKSFPRNVIERAAELAAWYSRRRTDSLCPVTVTPRKFVRKPKGLAEGQVLIEKESVVMVVPKGE